MIEELLAEGKTVDDLPTLDLPTKAISGIPSAGYWLLFIALIVISALLIFIILHHSLIMHALVLHPCDLLKQIPFHL